MKYVVDSTEQSLENKINQFQNSNSFMNNGYKPVNNTQFNFNNQQPVNNQFNNNGFNQGVNQNQNFNNYQQNNQFSTNNGGFQQTQQFNQQPVQQTMNSSFSQPQTALMYNGFIVDLSWVDDKIQAFENPENLVRLTNGTVSNNTSLANVTESIIRVLNNELEAGVIQSNNKTNRIRITLNQNNWGLDFVVTKDEKLHVNTVSIISTINSKVMAPSVYEKLNDARTQKPGQVQSWSTAVASMSQSNGRSSAENYNTYMTVIYNAVLTIFNEAQNHIKMGPNGQYIMSYSLYRLLADSNITVAGIKIRPIIIVENGRIVTRAQYDVTESIATTIKGALDYRDRMYSTK